MITATAWVGLVVVIINFASAFSIFTQIRLTYRRKNTIGLSRFPWAMATTNALSGVAYSVLIGDLTFLLSNLAWSVVNGTMLMLLLYYHMREKSRTGARVQ